MTRSRAFLAISAAITVGLGFFSGMAVSRHAKAPPRGHVYIVGDSVFLDIAALDALRASADHITTNDLGWTMLQAGSRLLYAKVYLDKPAFRGQVGATYLLLHPSAFADPAERSRGTLEILRELMRLTNLQFSSWSRWEDVIEQLPKSPRGE